VPEYGQLAFSLNIPAIYDATVIITASGYIPPSGISATVI